MPRPLILIVVAAFCSAGLVFPASVWGNGNAPVVHPPDNVYNAYSAEVGGETRAVAGFFDIDPGDEQWANFVRAAQDSVAYSLESVTLVKVVPDHVVCPVELPARTITQEGTENIRLRWPLMYELPSTTFTLTINYTTQAPYDDDGPGPNGADTNHTEVWRWNVASDLPHTSLLIGLWRDIPFGASEVPIISDEELYRTFQAELALAMEYEAAGDTQSKIEMLTDFGAWVTEGSMSLAPQRPNPTGPATGLANTLETPAGCRLMNEFFGGSSAVSHEPIQVFQVSPPELEVGVTPEPGVLDIDPGVPLWSNFVTAAAVDHMPYVLRNVWLTKQTPELLICPDMFPASVTSWLGSENIPLHFPLMFEPTSAFTLIVTYSTMEMYDDDGGGPNPPSWNHTEQWTWHVDVNMDSLSALLQLMRGSTPPLITDEALYQRLQAKLADADQAPDYETAEAALNELYHMIEGACGTSIVNTPEKPACCKLLVDVEYISGWAPPLVEPPDVSKAYPSVPMLWTPNGKMTPVTIKGVTDPGGHPVTIEITAITQDEPVSGGIYGSLGPDGTGVGTSTANLRAERASRANGRVYQVSFTATNSEGKSTNGSVSVGVPVPDPKRRNSTICIDDGQKYDSTAKK